MTKVYNEGINNQGKWRGMMDHRPRKLPVFDKVKRDKVDTPMSDNDDSVLYGWHPMYCVSGNPIPCEGLGYLGTAALIPQGVSVTYEVDVVAEGINDSVDVVLAFVPRHPVNDKSLRVALSIDNGEPHIVDYATKGRSEEWKQNILWNRAHRIVRVPVDTKKSRHTFTLTALDEGIILDTIYLVEDDYEPYWNK